MTTKTRKGDIVVLETTRTMFFINPYRSESEQEFKLVRVASAKRDGTVMAIEDTSLGLVRKLIHMCYQSPRIYYLSNHQEKARRLIDSTPEKVWKMISALKTAIEEA
jgi:hypothetical protein